MKKSYQFHHQYSNYKSTKEHALSVGDTYYYTGFACKKGHLSLRYSSSGNCVDCIAEKRGKTKINHRGRSSIRSEENHLLANEAIKNGFTTYESTKKCPKGHLKRFVTTNNCCECSEALNKKRKQQARWARIEKIYGISESKFNFMLKQQEFKCKICFIEINEQSSHIDHCHSTGLVRALLCNKCNQGIGLFDENIDSLKNAISYLEAHLNGA